MLRRTMLLALSASLSLASMGVYSPDAQAKTPAQISGTIVNRDTGKGISGVRVQQSEALEVAITDQNGHYQLPLSESSPSEIHIEKQGFESLDLALQEDDTALNIGLSPLNTYRVGDTLSIQQPVRTPHPLDTSLSGFYQIHGMSLSQADTHINGLGMNELGVDAQYRWQDWLFNGHYFNFRLPVNIANFPYSPAFFNNEFQIRLGAAHTFAHDKNLEWAIGPEVFYRNTSPDNRNNQNKDFIPFSNSLLDYPQSTFALGVRTVLGWQITDRLSLLPEVSVYPLGLASLEQAANSTLYMAGGHIGASAKYELSPGLSLMANYTKQLLFTGPAFEQGDYVRLGLSLDPWQMLQGEKE